jgi:hypothetical protein
MDKIDQKEDPSLLRSREKDNASNGRRKKLLSDSEEKFKEYGCLFNTPYEYEKEY